MFSAKSKILDELISTGAILVVIAVVWLSVVLPVAFVPIVLAGWPLTRWVLLTFNFGFSFNRFYQSNWAMVAVWLPLMVWHLRIVILVLDNQLDEATWIFAGWLTLPYMIRELLVLNSLVGPAEKFIDARMTNLLQGISIVGNLVVIAVIINDWLYLNGWTTTGIFVVNQITGG